ncbi:MAG: non-canonical purine NTP pyrophosphatase [Patescibacteria group bacterium]|nr:non-canonical purine NTP pyrophosphatase [Patescibacteria group bacterium]
MCLFFITGNKGKFEEVKAELSLVNQFNIDLPEIQEIDSRKIIKSKLLEALKYKKAEFIVEDTSLYLDCLNGLPGPLIKWFLASIGDKGIYELTRKFKNNDAQAKTIFGYAENENKIHFFEGIVSGSIVLPQGKRGFGWDRIFLPDGHKKTFAQMSIDEKNGISMRRIALDKLKHFLDAKQ